MGITYELAGISSPFGFVFNRRILGRALAGAARRSAICLFGERARLCRREPEHRIELHHQSVFQAEQYRVESLSSDAGRQLSANS